MGWADRARVERKQNGTEPKPRAPQEHAAWCVRSSGLSQACTCYPMPALRCNACGVVFEPSPKETAIRFHRRVRAHAMVHPDCNPSFAQGRVERRERVTPPDDLGETGGSDRRKDLSDPRQRGPEGTEP